MVVADRAVTAESRQGISQWMGIRSVDRYSPK
jgi:hypothetical protein